MQQLLDVTDEQLCSMKSVGVRVINEINDLKIEFVEEYDSVISHNSDENSMDKNMSVLEWALERPCNIKDCVIYDTNKVIVDNLELVDMALSVRSYGALRRAGIDNIIQLLSMEKSELKKVKNLGQKSIEEILGRVRYLTRLEENVASTIFICGEYYQDFMNDEYHKDIYSIKCYISRLFKEEKYREYREKFCKQIYYELLNSDYFSDLFASHLIKIIMKRGCASEDVLKDVFPGRLQKLQSKFITKYLELGILEIINEDIYIKKPSFKEYVNSIIDDR